MHPKLEKQFRERAVELGNSGDPAALPELVELTCSPLLMSGGWRPRPSVNWRGWRMGTVRWRHCNCFDEVFLERRNFETKVELQKNIRAKDGG